jgi:hypothetical protein
MVGIIARKKDLLSSLNTIMGDFRNFIEKDAEYFEARFRGGSGGAFGRDQGGGFDFSDRTRQQPIDLSAGRMGNRFQGIDDRVAAGKAMESRIIDALKSAGWEIRPATVQQDKYDKIDGFVKRGGSWLPLQIKYRDTGDEIAMETIFDWNPDQLAGRVIFNGRDMIGHAKLYACLNQGGRVIRVCSAEEAKSAAKDAANKLVQDFIQSGRRMATTTKAEARITGDPANGRAKVMAFVKPAAMSSLEMVPVGKSLWAA